MQSQDLTYQKIYAKLAKRTEKYAADVRNVYLKRMGEIARLCEGVEIPDGKVFHFNDYPEIATEAQKQLRSMYSELYQCVRGDVTREWYYANDDVDRLVKAMFGKEAAEQPHFAKYFQRNKQAMDAFFARKTEGMDLSQRVWRIVGEGKQEMELALDLGIGEGMDADTLSREVRKYLQEPDKLFRRVRDKHGELVLSKAAKAYHPGQGVYRSSYKNAMRVTRTETNMAYRTADVTRWQQLPFVTGYEVKTSKSHEARMPKGDICDDLAGVYPKGFVFKGWHPHCLCYIVPKLCTDKELEELTGRILDGTEDEFTPAGMVEDVPSQFTQWVSNNAERIENAKSLPYFLRDNYPNGDVTKAGKWVQEIANEAGMGNMAQVVAKSELELAKFTNVQAMSQEEWEACSNYVPAGNDELAELLNAKAGSAINAVSTLGDKATMDAILEQATKGVDAFGNWLSKEELVELQKVATMAKYATKQESKLVTHMGRKELEYALDGGKSAQFGQSLKFGTNYTKAAKGALAATEEEQVLVVVRTPAGSRYVQTMAGEAQQAVMLPNTKYKLLGTTEKTIVQAGGKTAKLMQYELELVDDGSSFVEQLVADNAKAQKELAAFAKAKHTAENVIKAASKGKYELLGVDTLELEDMLAMGTATSAELKAKTSELAKAMATAKKAALEEAKTQPNLWALAQEFGEDNANIFMQNWQKHMAKSSIYDTPASFLKKVIEKELYYAKLNPNKYPTTGKFIEYFEKLKVQYEAKVQLAGIQNEIDAVVTFASSCKSNAKIHGMVTELLQSSNSATLDMATVKSKLQVAKAEMDRLQKERIKLMAKKMAQTTAQTGGIDMSAVYTQDELNKYNLLHSELQSLLTAANGDWRAYAVRQKQDELAKYVTQLGVKYQSVNPKLPTIGGYTDAEVKQSLQNWLKQRYSDSYFGVYHEIGGEFQSYACEMYGMKIGIPKEELSILRRYTAGSNFINEYAFKADEWVNYVMPRLKAMSAQWNAAHPNATPVDRLKEYMELMEDYKRAYNNVCERMPRYNSHTFRGVNRYKSPKAYDEMIKNIQEAYANGGVWESQNPMSTSRRIGVADGFGTDATFLVHGRTGVDVNPFSSFQGEDEYVFRAGSKFRVLRIEKAKKADIAQVGSWIIELEEIL